MSQFSRTASAQRNRRANAPVCRGRDEAKINRGVPDDAAADSSDRDSGALPGVLFAASGDAEQVDAALRRLRQFRISVQARNLLAGREAVVHLRDHGRGLQGADRLHRRAFRSQHSGQGPAQMARHAAGAVGDSAGHEHAGVAVAVRPVLQRLQLHAVVFRHRADPVDRRRQAGHASPSFWSTSGTARRSS
mgnify:CR=1 FL=1